MEDFIYSHQLDMLSAYKPNLDDQFSTDSIEDFYFSCAFVLQRLLDRYLTDKESITPVPELENLFTFSWCLTNNFDLIQKFNQQDSRSIVDNSLVLINAGRNGCFCTVKYMIERGADFRVEHNILFQDACENGNLPMVKYLIDKGVNIKADSNYAFELAAENGHLDVVKLLIERGINPRSNNDCAVKLATENGFADMVSLLVDNGAPSSYLQKVRSTSAYVKKHTKYPELVGKTFYKITNAEECHNGFSIQNRTQCTRSTFCRTWFMLPRWIIFYGY